MDADEYERMAAAAEHHWWYVATRRLLSETVLTDVATGSIALDAAGGNGATGRWLAGRVATVIADLDTSSLAVAGALPGYLPVQADLCRLPLPDDTFDVVLCVTALYHAWVSDPAAVVAEFARVTKPGGTVCLMEPGVRWLRRGHDRVTHNARRFSRRDLAQLLSGAGLDVQRATGAYTFLVPPAAVLAVLERNKQTSDVGRNQTGLGGVFPVLAGIERSILRHVDLPTGLSVIATATKP